jgi:uncharacterized protein (UPF0332 family)
MSASPFLAKANEALKAAQILLDQGCADSAANRAYYASFHAARAALIAAGVSSAGRFWSHEAVPGGLSQLVHRRKRYPAHLVGDLAGLLDVRLVADYREETVSLREARRSVKTAAAFVSIIDAGIQP